MEQQDRSPKQLDSLFYPSADAFFPASLPYGLTYDDVSLATLYSEVLPRETNLETSISDKLKLSLPIISADMDTVTEGNMAIAMAMNGGMGLIHYNMPKSQQLREVSKVKNHVHGLIQDPITVRPNQSIGDVLDMIEKHSYSFHTFPVTDENKVLLGLLRGRVVKERYRSHTVLEAMTPREEVFTIREDDLGSDPIQTADKAFQDNMGIHKLLVLDDGDHLRGLFTLKDIERINTERLSERRPARDSQFSLICGAAISTVWNPDGSINKDATLGHVGALVERGVDAIAISTAHGFTRGVGASVKLISDAFKDRITIIAGNVTSAEGVEYLADCGAHAIKVGQGPGSICTTRIVAGVGIPQFTAVYACSRAAQKKGVRIIADGGITKSGDMVKALTLADAVICGSLLAGAREAPGQIMEIDGKVYKQYRGMGSLTAMKAGSAARYGHDNVAIKMQKMTAEGIEALKEVSGTLDHILQPLAGGIQSGMGYLGARTLKEMREKARYIRVTAAGQRESSPHDVIEVKTSS
ncbi:MAG: IMP dehydrogenase [Opitutales bacterium]|nr:IMP dehydrogenase [Opitutales bacterium]